VRRQVPGGDRDRFAEAHVTVTVQPAAPAGAALADFDTKMRGRLPGELGAVLDSEEARARGARIVDAAAAAAEPARVVVALPMAVDRLAAAQREALRDAVARCAGVNAGCVAVAAAAGRVHLYCEHADPSGLRKALARLPGPDAACAARSGTLSDPAPVAGAPAPASVAAELWEALDAEERAAEAARAACAAAEDARRAARGAGGPGPAAESHAMLARKRRGDAEDRLRRAAVELAAARFAAQTAAWAAAGVLRRQGRARQGGHRGLHVAI
jgi:hypothetical protein